MKKYRFFKELEGKTLEYGDMLSIANIIHIVQSDHLINLQGCGNDYVFTLLDVTSKEQFCQEHYGYLIRGMSDNFPSSKPDDYEALTRVSIALMKVSEEQDFLPPMIYSSSKELKGKILNSEDKVIFDGVKYIVEDDFSNLCMRALDDGISDAYIFKILEISDVVDFCRKYYGYTPLSGVFPETRDNGKEDCNALTRLTVALFKLSEFKIVQNALDECACVKEQIKTPSLISMAENLEKLLEGRDPNSKLSGNELKMVRELFNTAEDQIQQK